MRLSKGVEWATHACTTMVALPEGKGLSTEDLAEYFDLPSAYLAKQLQALRRAGILESVRGQSGGYRLARDPGKISLWDIVDAIEGGETAFRCTEIRQNGPCGAKRSDCRKPCEIAAAFWHAEAAWREALKRETLAGIIGSFAAKADPERMRLIADWRDSRL